MADLTKVEVFREAQEKIKPITNEVEVRKKKLVENAAVIISFSVIALSIILYAFNTGYCKVFNLPTEVMSLDMTRLLPLVFQILSIATFILLYISSLKADRALKKNRFNLVRIIWGAYIVSHFFSVNNVPSVIGKWWNLLLIYLIPILVEAMIYWAKKPKKIAKVTEAEHQTVLEDTVQDSIFATYYIKYGIFAIVLPFVVAPMMGQFSANAQREYQTCVVNDMTYAVVVDYEDKVLVQQAAEQNGTLQIDTSSYTYIDKKDIVLQYTEYASVDIGLNEEHEEPTTSNNSWIKIKEVLSMPSITDWLMLGITFVYVVATIFICRANIRSAKASKEQLAEMKREHEESIRLQVIPFLQVEETAETAYGFELDLPLAAEEKSDWTMANIVKIKNLGNGAATNIIYEWSSEKNEISMCEAFPINAISAGGEYKACFSFDCVKSEIDTVIGTLILHFDDMRGFSYTQRIIIRFCQNRMYTGIKEIDSDAPIYMGIKENA